MTVVHQVNQRRKKSERGNALVEFALSWAVIWAAFAGVYQFGYTFYVYNSLLTAVADAAQLGSRMNYDTANTAAFTNSLTNMVVYGDTTTGTKPIVPNLTSANVTVSLSLNGTIPSDVTVTITNFTVDAFFTKFTFDGKPRATAAYMGHVVCSTC